MKLIISSVDNKDIFFHTFQLLKKCNDLINISFKSDFVYLQGMDTSHICLYEIKFLSSWFSTYTPPLNKTNENISINSGFLFNVLSAIKNSNNYFEEEIVLFYDDDSAEKLNINVYNKITKEINKEFAITLCNVELDNELDIPDSEYDYEWIINSNEINKNMSQLLTFGENINIKCSENFVKLKSFGVSGEMIVIIKVDDLENYETIENIVDYDAEYSLKVITKYCLTNNLSKNIKFSIKEDIPLKILYDLGDAYISFYLAPLLCDNETD
jgi:proliferating cell nuclear antigen PCNA